MSDYSSFSGSYLADDVHFLLKPIKIEMTPIELKEQFIQSGTRHYSDMLSQEPEPSSWHLDLFVKALESGGKRLAKEVVGLAKSLILHFENTPIILTSLVRAGVPLGVMLHRALKAMGKESHHYGISIIRDRGIDTTALSWIEQRHGTESIVFVDGWTGKGAIIDELTHCLKERSGYLQQPKIVVLADPCGRSWLAASDDDWLIPFGIMGAPISGLISRSIWSGEGLHRCVICHHLEKYECSRKLIDVVTNYWEELDFATITPHNWDRKKKLYLKEMSQQIISSLAKKYQVNNINRIKPGIAEATRAVLRRVPEHILVRSINDPDVALLVYLAREKNIIITEVGEDIGQYRAVTIIKKVY